MKTWEVTAVFTVQAETEEEVWVKWGKDEDVSYECIHSIEELWNEDDDEEEDEGDS
jgi:hypothetical protein